ncbi:hypothetical protein MRX96_035910 [Rhipicephalus microplus]
MRRSSNTRCAIGWLSALANAAEEGSCLVKDSGSGAERLATVMQTKTRTRLPVSVDEQTTPSTERSNTSGVVLFGVASVVTDNESDRLLRTALAVVARAY